uniref:RNA polymerase subunit H/Rpb5 C-terminal domain-containing protein n=1 Tax=viral metagenome TaxID=1070528 RepID=A0A6C0EV16_9ZZZZ
MDSNNSYIKQLYTARNNIISYLKNNGYDCEEFDHFCIEEINIMKNTDELSFMVSNTLGEKCYIKYVIDESYKHNVLKKTNFPGIIYDIFVDPDKKVLGKKDTLLIITTNYSEDSMHQIIKSAWEIDNHFIVLFTLAHLQINILNHSYVPKHIKLTDDEKMEFLKTYNVNETQIPEISRFDPVARAICLKPNDVCKIIRYDKISFNNDYYRICVS